jgi:hypothetical protein
MSATSNECPSSWENIKDLPYVAFRKNGKENAKTLICILNRVSAALYKLKEGADTQGNVGVMKLFSFYRQINHCIHDLYNVARSCQYSAETMVQRSYADVIFTAVFMEVEAGLRSLGIFYKKENFYIRIGEETVPMDATFPISAHTGLQKVVEDKRSDVLYLYRYVGYIHPIPGEVDSIVVALSFHIHKWYAQLKVQRSQFDADLEKSKEACSILEIELNKLLDRCADCRLVNIHLQIDEGYRHGFRELVPHSFDDFGGWRYEIKQLIQTLFKIKCKLLACIYRVKKFKDLISYQVHYLMMAIKNIKSCIKAHEKGKKINFIIFKVIMGQLARAWVRNSVFNIKVYNTDTMKSMAIYDTIHDAMKDLSTVYAALEPASKKEDAQAFGDALPVLGVIINQLTTSMFHSTANCAFMEDVHTFDRSSSYMEVFYSLFQLDMLVRASLKMNATGDKNMSMVTNVDNKMMLSTHCKVIIGNALRAVHLGLADEQKNSVLFKDLERFLDNEIYRYDGFNLHAKLHDFMVILFDLAFTFTNHQERFQFAIDRITSYDAYTTFLCKTKNMTIANYIKYYVDSLTIISPIIFALAPIYDSVCADTYRIIKQVIHSIFIVKLPFKYEYKPLHDAAVLKHHMYALQREQRLGVPLSAPFKPITLNTSYDTDDHCYHPSDF